MLASVIIVLSRNDSRKLTADISNTPLLSIFALLSRLRNLFQMSHGGPVRFDQSLNRKLHMPRSYSP